jgi:hypothetical protein
MSFTIKLQKNDSEDIRLDKELTDVKSLTGTLKSQTSIVNPVIIVDTNLSDIKKCNYMTIDAFGRKYFITDIVSVNNKLVEISAHCDVLSTYKSQIRANTGILKRSENNWNLYLDDGSLKVYNNPKVLCANFPSGFSAWEYVLAVAGR